jgi:hypothetical protein
MTDRGIRYVATETEEHRGPSLDGYLSLPGREHRLSRETVCSFHRKSALSTWGTGALNATIEQACLTPVRTMSLAARNPKIRFQQPKRNVTTPPAPLRLKDAALMHAASAPPSGVAGAQL